MTLLEVRPRLVADSDPAWMSQNHDAHQHQQEASKCGRNDTFGYTRFTTALASKLKTLRGSVMAC